MNFKIFALTWAYKKLKIDLQPKKNITLSNSERCRTGQLLDGATVKSTKYATMYAVTVFKGEKHIFTL